MKFLTYIVAALGVMLVPFGFSLLTSPFNDFPLLTPSTAHAAAGYTLKDNRNNRIALVDNRLDFYSNKTGKVIRCKFHDNFNGIDDVGKVYTATSYQCPEKMWVAGKLLVDDKVLWVTFYDRNDKIIYSEPFPVSGWVKVK
ncbi:hypothetical protein TOTORO_01220 [Serratia phage vB_SmaS-Totoro]|nr:hypothetical protein TOTORO_01220 [Serratia phage vB_SmaS-Totoro]